MQTPSTEKILYELLVYAEWKLEPEFSRLSKAVSPSVQSLPFLLTRLSSILKRKEASPIINSVNSQVPWKLATGGDGQVVAILQDSILEIRTARDEYTSVVGKATVQKDAWPHLRKLEWSPDCSMVALANSNGTISAFDLLGSNLFVIPSENTETFGDSVQALAALIFIDIRFKSTKWSHELISIDYNGILHSYLVSSSGGYQNYHKWSFSPLKFWKGISCVTYHQKNHMLIVGSPVIVNSKAKENWQWGLSSWRLINDVPYYRATNSDSDDRSYFNLKYSMLSWIPVFSNSLINQFVKQSAVFRMQISPEGQQVACLHSCGTISIWHLPSLRLNKLWTLEEQPNFNLENKMYKRKSGADQLKNSTEFHPVDINWWSEKSLTVARNNGAVTVCCVDTLENLLGESPEFLSRQPQLSSTSGENGILALECQIHPLKTKLSNDNEEEASSSDDEEKSTLWSRGSDMIRSTCFFFTDLERFKPKRKRPKLVYKIYQMLAIISRTPEELFTRMIESESYEEALSLAEVYNLDADRVYQSQWRKTPVSVSSIHNFLSKIHSKTWVLYECCERVPETLSAVKELISFGLKYTDRLAVLKDEENPKSTNGSIDGSLSTFDVSKLSEEAKQMITFRKKLLRLSDRLFTYQSILESTAEEPNLVESLYDHETYDKFQKLSIIESAIQYARKSDVNAVYALLTYHGDETIPFWLNILDNIPETLRATNYRSLLPECKDGKLIDWKRKKIRDKDWCELEPLASIGEIDVLSAENSEHPSDLTVEAVYQWYRRRICSIEKNTNLVDRALVLLRIAKEKQVKDLDNLEFELEILDVLVHEVYIEDITLESLQKKTMQEKLKLLMSTTTPDNFIANLKQLLIPFLDRCEVHQSGSKMKLISSYLLDLSVKNLEYIVKFVQFIMMFDLFEDKTSIFSSLEAFVSLIIECIYNCQNTDEIDRVSFIVSLLPQHDLNKSVEASRNIWNSIKTLEAEIMCLKILLQHHIKMSLQHIHKIKDDHEAVFSLLSGIGKGKNLSGKNLSPSEWNQLLLDLLQLHSHLFSCLSEQNCYEIYASILLNNEHSSSIMFAANVLCCNPSDEHKRKITFASSLDLVLKAARSYFNNSATVSDNSMVLAKVCLRLMPEENKDICDELDLIAAVHLLSEFKVVLLPMQVRQCPDRMKMIDKCLKSRPDNYCKTDKLFKLAKLLRIHETDSRLREATILLKCLEVSFEAKNYSFCGQKCLSFIREEQPLGWEICRNVANCEEYKDLETRKKLAVFSLAYCPPNFIEEIIQIKHRLEYKILRSSIQDQMTEAVAESGNEISHSETKFLQSIVTDKVLNLTSTLFNNKLSKVFWDYTSSKDISQVVEEENNDDMKRQGIPDFYETVHTKCDCVPISKTNNSTLDMNLALLTQCLFELKTSTLDISMENSFNKLLANCAELSVADDLPLSLFFLLSMRGVDEIVNTLDSLPKTMCTLQFAVLIFAFRICSLLPDFKLPTTPKNIVYLAEKNHLQDLECYKLMLKYKKALDNLKESEKLEVLECGINTARFATDETYKLDSILGLAMSQDSNQFYLAIQLGATHGVSLTEIVVSHVTSLLFSCVPNLVEKISGNDLLLKLLKEDCSNVLSQLEERYYKPTDGTNHNGLVAYFSVLSLFAEDVQFYNLSAKEHVKLIKKVKATSPLIDYKNLIEKPESIVSVFEPALSEKTVNSLLKLIKVLPSFLKDSVSFPLLYSCLINKIYHTEDGSSEVDRVAKCVDYIGKISPEDALKFVQTSLLSEKCVRNNTISERLSLLESIISVCQKRSDFDFSATLNYLEASYSSLQVIENLLEECLESEADTPDHLVFFQSLDLHHTDPTGLRNAFFSALVSLTSVPVVELIKACENLNCGFSLKSVLSEVILSAKDNIESISAILLRVNECIDKNFVEKEWIPQLESLLSCHSLPPKQKIQLNHTLNKLQLS
nr:PREDICTED: neuroblastoma-amplified sequence-like [Bemisia tabaci]